MIQEKVLDRPLLIETSYPPKRGVGGGGGGSSASTGGGGREEERGNRDAPGEAEESERLRPVEQALLRTVNSTSFKSSEWAMKVAEIKTNLDAGPRLHEL